MMNFYYKTRKKNEISKLKKFTTKMSNKFLFFFFWKHAGLDVYENSSRVMNFWLKFWCCYSLCVTSLVFLCFIWIFWGTFVMKNAWTILSADKLVGQAADLIIVRSQSLIPKEIKIYFYFSKFSSKDPWNPPADTTIFKQNKNLSMLRYHHNIHFKGPIKIIILLHLIKNNFSSTFPIDLILYLWQQWDDYKFSDLNG
jgi:hypothetical protein